MRAASPNLRSQLVDQWIAADAADCLTNLSDESDRPPRIVFRDEVGDGFEVGFNEGGKLDPH